MLNSVQLIGNAGKAPEIGTTSQGRKYARFSLATSERWRDKATGEKRERTEWHTIVVWAEGLVGVVETYVEKGTRLYVQGSLVTRKWQDQAGHDRWSTEVVLQGIRHQLLLLSSRNGATARPGAAPVEAPDGPLGSPGRPDRTLNDGPEDLDDAIPF